MKVIVQKNGRLESDGGLSVRDSLKHAKKKKRKKRCVHEKISEEL